MECHLICTLYAHHIQLVPLFYGTSSHMFSGEKSGSTDVSSETNRWQGWCLVVSVFLYKSGFNSRNSAFSNSEKQKRKIKVCIIWTRVCFYNLPRNYPKVTLNNVGRASESFECCQCLCPITLTKTPICSSLGGSSVLYIHAVSRLWQSPI